MENENKGPKADAVVRMREFRKKIREESRAKAKEKVAEIEKRKNDKQVALPKASRRKDLDL